MVNIPNRHKMGCKVNALAEGRIILALHQVHGAEAEIQTQMEHWLLSLLQLTGIVMVGLLLGLAGWF